jgi:hypothetical protein
MRHMLRTIEAWPWIVCDYGGPVICKHKKCREIAFPFTSFTLPRFVRILNTHCRHDQRQWVFQSPSNYLDFVQTGE